MQDRLDLFQKMSIYIIQLLLYSNLEISKIGAAYP